jgi:hypothetical protein
MDIWDTTFHRYCDMIHQGEIMKLFVSESDIVAVYRSVAATITTLYTSYDQSERKILGQ